jgi:hypothetical protein
MSASTATARKKKTVKKKKKKTTTKSPPVKKKKKKKAPTKAQAPKVSPQEVRAKEALNSGSETKGQIRKRVKELANSVDDSYMELGRLLWRVSYGKLFEDWGHDDFESYVSEEIPNCGSRKAKYLVAIWKRYTVDLGVPPKKLVRVGWTKAKTLLPVLDKDGTNLEKWLDLARTKSVKQLEAEVQKAKGKGSGVVTNTLSFKLDDSQHDNVLEALEAIKVQTGNDAKGYGLDLMCTEWRSTIAKTSADGGKRLRQLIKSIERTHGVILIGCKSKEMAKKVMAVLKAEKGSSSEAAPVRKKKKKKKKKRRVSSEDA